MNQNKQSNAGKKLFVFRILASVSVMVLSALSLLDVWENSLYLSIPLLSFVLLTQAIEEWNRSRKIAIFILCVTVFLWIITGVVYFTTWFAG